MGRLATELLIKGEPDRVIHRIDLAMLCGDPRRCSEGLISGTHPAPRS